MIDREVMPGLLKHRGTNNYLSLYVTTSAVRWRENIRDWGINHTHLGIPLKAILISLQGSTGVSKDCNCAAIAMTLLHSVSPRPRLQEERWKERRDWRCSVNASYALRWKTYNVFFYTELYSVFHGTVESKTTLAKVTNSLFDIKTNMMGHKS